MEKEYFQNVVNMIMKRYPDKDERDYVSGIITRERNGFTEVYCYNFTEFLKNLNDFIKKGKSDWSEKELREQSEHFVFNESHHLISKGQN